MLFFVIVWVMCLMIWLGSFVYFGGTFGDVLGGVFDEMASELFSDWVVIVGGIAGKKSCAFGMEL